MGPSACALQSRYSSSNARPSLEHTSESDGSSPFKTHGFCAASARTRTQPPPGQPPTAHPARTLCVLPLNVTTYLPRGICTGCAFSQARSPPLSSRFTSPRGGPSAASQGPSSPGPVPTTLLCSLPSAGGHWCSSVCLLAQHRYSPSQREPRGARRLPLLSWHGTSQL